MSTLAIVGGVYHEACVWPEWDQIYGSGGRAAAAVQGHVQSVQLHCYARSDVEERLRSIAKAYDFAVTALPVAQAVSFEYVHSLSVPIIRPPPTQITPNPTINVAGDCVLRFGMMEGSARVTARHCVYDPQSAIDARPFAENGSTAEHLAIVGNRSEIAALGGEPDPMAAASKLLSGKAEVIVIKSGSVGAIVVDHNGSTLVPPYRTDSVWKVGSGDVFAALFACYWGVHHRAPHEAAGIASRAVADYVESMALPAPLPDALLQKGRPIAKSVHGRVYLASPFFTMGQRWLVDEARLVLKDMGLDVFSPVHDVGPGPASIVAPADLAALDTCDVVFAILDGNDPGTIFEVGYARSKNLPVYALAQTVSSEDLKMVEGSGCRVFDDFVTAIHHVAWRT